MSGLAAQPALLYLVPACLGASVIVGMYKGELTTVLFTYEEEDGKKTPETKKEGSGSDGAATAGAKLDSKKVQ